MLLPGQRENDLFKILIVTTCALELGALWWVMDTTNLPRSFEHEILSTTLTRQPRGVLPYITNTGMCCATGSWFWSSWFRTGYPFQRHFLEWGIKIVDHGFIFCLTLLLIMYPGFWVIFKLIFINWYFTILLDSDSWNLFNLIFKSLFYAYYSVSLWYI